LSGIVVIGRLIVNTVITSLATPFLPSSMSSLVVLLLAVVSFSIVNTAIMFLVTLFVTINVVNMFLATVSFAIIKNVIDVLVLLFCGLFATVSSTVIVILFVTISLRMVHGQGIHWKRVLGEAI
jgi:hypothetical protein